MKKKILIVDDETAARKKIRSFLAEYPDVEIIEASNGREAIEKIQQEQPDLVFLDIQMPKITGFEVIDAIGLDNMPVVVFTTAYEQYAVDAFEVHAFDYLLKPFDQARFNKMYVRAMEHLSKKEDQSASIQNVINEIRQHEGGMKRILVKEGSKYIFIRTESILYITSDEKYVELHTEKKRYLIRETLSNLETRLDAAKFIRIHRTAILNIEYLHEIHPFSHGDCTAIMTNGKQLTISRKYRDRILK